MFERARHRDCGLLHPSCGLPQPVRSRTPACQQPRSAHRRHSHTAGCRPRCGHSSRSHSRTHPRSRPRCSGRQGSRTTRDGHGHDDRSHQGRKERDADQASDHDRMVAGLVGDSAYACREETLPAPTKRRQPNAGLRDGSASWAMMAVVCASRVCGRVAFHSQLEKAASRSAPTTRFQGSKLDQQHSQACVLGSGERPGKEDDARRRAAFMNAARAAVSDGRRIPPSVQPGPAL